MGKPGLETQVGLIASTENRNEIFSCSRLTQTSNKGMYVLQHLGLIRQKHIVIRTLKGDHMCRGHAISTDFSCLSVKASNAVE
jgi:hypothetical protein